MADSIDDIIMTRRGYGLIGCVDGHIYIYIKRLGSNPGQAISEGCFIFHFTPLPLEVARRI